MALFDEELQVRQSPSPFLFALGALMEQPRLSLLPIEAAAPFCPQRPYALALRNPLILALESDGA
jgi:hypothetical protein